VLLAAVACASKAPPPPVIETQEAELSGRREPAPAPAPSAPADAFDVPVSPGATGSPTAPQPIGASDAESAPQVKLLDAGAPPRRALLHVFKRGTRQRLGIKANTRVKGASMALPTISLDAPMEAKIVEVNAAGDARFEFSAGPFKTGTGGGGGAVGSMLGGALGAGAPEKIAGWGWITPGGVVREFHVEEGASDGDSPVEKGDPFPTEPVGVGARWEVLSTFEEKGVTVRQTSTYQVTKLETKAVHTKLTRVQVPLGATDESAAGSAKSSGQLSYRFGEVYPTGRLKMTRAMQLDLTGLGGGPPLVMASEVTISKR